MPLHTFGSFSKGSSSKKPVINNFKGVGRRLDSNTSGENAEGISDSVGKGTQKSSSQNTEALEIDSNESVHSSEGWQDEVSDNFEESEEEEVEGLGLPAMEEEVGNFAGSDWYDDLTMELVKNEEAVDEEDQIKGVQKDDKFNENERRFSGRMKSIAKRYRIDGKGDAKLRDDEISGVLDWTKDDSGAAYSLVPDDEGAYVRTGPSTYKPVNGKGAILQRAGKTNAKDGAFKVVKAKANESTKEP